ncbi:unnamed protein product [Rotaria socialis]|uniref:Uncharacterized protein n=1 Tax=Rotaria socialis TaxID=392032 RepID=A0A818G1Y4_9BILA|nr:unnamed protein product [Rotaria socialis]CAF4821775.1 unnamed protein product [Rotaria socialis]
MAIRLSSQSTAMLNLMNTLAHDTDLPFNAKFRVQLRPASFYNKDKDIQYQLWELRMNVDPVSWFDLQWRQCEDNEEYQHKCLAKKKNSICADHPKHSTIVCRTKAKRQRDDDIRPYGQYLIEEFIVSTFEIFSFLITSHAAVERCNV